MSNKNVNNIQKFLEDQGIDRNSYVLIDTEKDNYIKPFNAPNEAVEKLDFEYDKERIEEYGLPFVNDYNNGTSSILFANGVCVVSQSPEMQDLIQKMADGASQHLEKNALSAMNQMGVPLSNWETLVSPDGSTNSQTAEVETMKATCDAIKEAKANQKDAQIRESVASQLEEMGIEAGTYMMFTEQDAKGVCAQTLNNQQCPISASLREGVHKIGENDVIASQNSGVAAFYFKEGVYVVSPSQKAIEKAHEIENKNGFIGVSIGKEPNFSTPEGKPLDNLNGKWAEVCETVNKNEIKERQESMGLKFSEALYNQGVYNNR